MVLYESASGDMACIGLTYRAREWAANGIYSFKIDKEGHVYDSKENEIPLSLIYNNPKKLKKAKAKGVGYISLKLRQVVEQVDNSTIIVSEQNLYVNSSTSSGGRITYYIYDDILISKISSSQEVKWMHSIKKDERASSLIQTHDSYHYITKNDSHYIFYHTMDKTTKKFNFLVDIINDKTGHVQQKTLLKERFIKVNPRSVIILPDNSIFIESTSSQKKGSPSIEFIKARVKED
jgi:hypothetical protein